MSAPRTHCDLCGREIPGGHHPAVLLITHHVWKHERATGKARR